MVGDVREAGGGRAARHLAYSGNVWRSHAATAGVPVVAVMFADSLFSSPHDLTPASFRAVRETVRLSVARAAELYALAPDDVAAFEAGDGRLEALSPATVRRLHSALQIMTQVAQYAEGARARAARARMTVDPPSPTMG